MMKILLILLVTLIADCKVTNGSDVDFAVPLSEFGARLVDEDAPSITTTAAPTNLTQNETVTAGSGETNVTVSSKFDEEVIPLNLTESEGDAVKILEPTFDCRREGHNCDVDGGLCSLKTGKCDCFDGYSNFICRDKGSSIASSVSVCNNGLGCGNSSNATCLTDGGSTAVCSCPYHLYGPACENARYELRCSATDMILKVAPYGYPSFTGKIVILEYENETNVDNPACQFQKQGDLNVLKVAYEDVIQQCKGFAEGNMTKIVKFIVQAHPTWLTHWDKIFTAKCTDGNKTIERTLTVIAPATSGVEGDNGTVKGVPVLNDLSEMPSDAVRVDYTGATSEVTGAVEIIVMQKVNESDSDWVPIFKKVKIGDTIAFKIQNRKPQFYPKMRVESCQLEMQGRSEPLGLITSQCPASKMAWAILLWKETKVENTSTTFQMRLPAIAVPGQPPVIELKCQITLCSSETSEDCKIEPDGCRKHVSYVSKQQQVANYGRKKRSADDHPSMTTVSASIEMQYPSGSTSSLSVSNPSLVILISVLFLVTLLC